MDRSEIEKIVKARGWLALQTNAFQQAVLSRATLIALGARDYVFHTGDDLGGVYGVIGGGVGVYIAGNDAGLSLGHVLRTGAWFGHGPAITRRTRTLTFRALEPTQALFLPLAAIKEIAASSPDFMRGVASMAEFGTDAAIAVAADLLIRRSDRRIAATLLRVTTVAEGIASPHPDGFHLTQTDLAEMSNVSRDVMNRTLSRFKSEGWIETKYNRIAILDGAALSQFAAGGRLKAEPRVGRKRRAHGAKETDR